MRGVRADKYFHVLSGDFIPIGDGDEIIFIWQGAFKIG